MVQIRKLFYTSEDSALFGALPVFNLLSRPATVPGNCHSFIGMSQRDEYRQYY